MPKHHQPLTPATAVRSIAVPTRRRAASALAFLMMTTVGCGGGDPFRYTRVSGEVRYRDGNPLVVPDLQLAFYPLQEPKDRRTHPRPGSAVADPRTGKFTAATTRSPGDGLVRGRHKVTLHTTGRSTLPIDVAGPEYGDPATTPLEVDTDKLPFQIRVQRPAIVAVRGAVTHENGMPLKVPGAVCGFHVPKPLSRDFREVATAALDAQTGAFSSVSHGDGNGLFAGSYRVTIRGVDGGPLDATAVPETYADPRTSPLTLDTAASPVTLTIPNP